MRDSDKIVFVVMVSLIVVLVIAILAFTAGNIVNQLFKPVPSVAGPLGAAAALLVFIYLIFGTAELLFG